MNSGESGSMKTKLTNSDVNTFLNTIKNEQKRDDAFVISKLMQKVTKSEPRIWGTSIVGFGDNSYKLANGREIKWFKVGFSPRKANFALYLSPCLKMPERLLKKLGKYKTAKACIYIDKIESINLSVLQELIKASLS